MGKAVAFGAVRGDDEDPRPVDGSQGPQFIGGLERANHKGCAIEIHRLGVLAVLLSGRSRFPPRGDDVADRGESQRVSTAPVATKLVSRVHCGPETLVEGKSREVVALELSQEVAEADLMSRVPVGSELRLELRGQHPEVGANGATSAMKSSESVACISSNPTTGTGCQRVPHAKPSPPQHARLLGAIQALARSEFASFAGDFPAAPRS
jgi:hypothetical protein